MKQATLADFQDDIGKLGWAAYHTLLSGFARGLDRKPLACYQGSDDIVTSWTRWYDADILLGELRRGSYYEPVI